MLLAVYSLFALAAVVCARVDCWEFVILFGIVSLGILFKREARSLRKRASALRAM